MDQFCDFTRVPHKVVYEGWTGWLSSSTFRFKNGVKLRDEKTAVRLKTGELKPIGTVVIEWLKTKTKRPHLVKKYQSDLMVLYPPLYAHSGISRGAYVYMDLEAAYPSIYKRLSWEDEFIPSAWARRSDGGLLLDDFPFPEHKLARNAVMGIARGGRSMYYEDGKLVRILKMGGFTNHHLLSCIMTVLHHIAHEMVHTFKAEYFNTDGGIVPESQSEKAAKWVQDTYGLNLRAKHEGRAEIRGVGSYKVGDYKTGLWLNRPRSKSKLWLPPTHDIDRVLWLLR